MKMKKQSTDYTCGPACIHMLIPELSEERIAACCGTTPEVGTTPVKMGHFLSKYFEVEVLQTTDYQDNDIILVQQENYGHWIIMLNGKLYDPWTGEEQLGKLDTHALVEGAWYDDLVIRLSKRLNWD